MKLLPDFHKLVFVLCILCISLTVLCVVLFIRTSGSAFEQSAQNSTVIKGIVEMQRHQQQADSIRIATLESRMQKADSLRNLSLQTINRNKDEDFRAIDAFNNGDIRRALSEGNR